eukprot:170269-Rhodomonas_salina.1
MCIRDSPPFLLTHYIRKRADPDTNADVVEDDDDDDGDVDVVDDVDLVHDDGVDDDDDDVDDVNCFGGGRVKALVDALSGSLAAESVRAQAEGWAAREGRGEEEWTEWRAHGQRKDQGTERGGRGEESKKGVGRGGGQRRSEVEQEREGERRSAEGGRREGARREEEAAASDVRGHVRQVEAHVSDAAA